MNPPPLSQGSQIESVRSGQRLIIIAILLNILSFAIQVIISGNLGLITGGLMAIASLVLSILGILRMATGLNYSVALRVVFCILMLVPCVSLIVLLVLNAKATASLRANGYKVGLLGADKR